MTNSFRNQARQSSVTQAKKSRSRKKPGQIEAGKPLPLRVLDCREGNVTSQGTGMLHFDLQHLESNATFSSTVFEDVAPEYMDTQILDAVLPTEMEDYELEDLIDGGLIATLEFNHKNGKTYINIVHVEPLDDHYQEVLEDLIAEEQQQQQKSRKQKKSLEAEMEENSPDDDEELELETYEDDVHLDEDDIDLDLDVNDLDEDDDDPEFDEDEE